MNTIKDDAIFDQYLGTEDDGGFFFASVIRTCLLKPTTFLEIEPRNLHTRQVYRLLDLAATEEDQHEVRLRL